MHWDDLKPLLWSAAGGAFAAIVVGFAWGGWMTTGGANDVAKRVAEDSVADRLAPICVALAKNDPERDRKIVALKGTESWRRGDAVAGFNWATMPGEQKPDSKVAERCAVLVLQAGS